MSADIQDIISTLDLYRAQNAMPSTIGKWKLFRIKHTTFLEGETFLRNKLNITFFKIKCSFFGRKENTISNCLFIRYNLIKPQYGVTLDSANRRSL